MNKQHVVDKTNPVLHLWYPNRSKANCPPLGKPVAHPWLMRTEPPREFAGASEKNYSSRSAVTGVTWFRLRQRSYNVDIRREPVLTAS